MLKSSELLVRLHGQPWQPRHFANGAIAAFVQRGRLDSQPIEFVNANLHEQSHLQHSLFPASAGDFCESIEGNG